MNITIIGRDMEILSKEMEQRFHRNMLLTIQKRRSSYLLYSHTTRGMMKLLLDMDGVIVDFVNGWLKLMGLQYPTDWPLGEYSLNNVFKLTNEQVLERITEEFWANLLPYPWLEELTQALEARSNDICLVTRVPKGIGASGKIQWIKQYLPKYPFLVGTGRDFCANPNTILIDDCDGNVNRFRTAGGKAILFPQIWNTESHYTSIRIKRVIKQVDELCKK